MRTVDACCLPGFPSSFVRSLCLCAFVVSVSAADELVYERTYSGNQDLYVQPAGGGVERRLTDDPEVDALPRFSRDGKRGDLQLEADRRVAALRGRRRGRSAPAASARTAPWSTRPTSRPTGACWPSCRTSKGRSGCGSGPARAPRSGPLVKHGGRTVMGNPHWSPDGKRLVFSSNWRVGHHIYVVDVATGGGVSALHPGGRRLRAALQPRRIEGGLRQPGPHLE